MISLLPVDDFSKFLNKFEKHIFTVKKELSKKSPEKR
jgi:hypothetical protein